MRDINILSNMIISILNQFVNTIVFVVIMKRHEWNIGLEKSMLLKQEKKIYDKNYLYQS